MKEPFGTVHEKISGISLRVCVAATLTVALKADSPVEFEPGTSLISDKCFTCHGPDKANRKTALRFDQEAGARIELGKGKFAIVAGHPESSEMYRRITSDTPAQRMPPPYAGQDKLNDREIALIRAWLEQGAVWQKHWSHSPPVRAAVPGSATNAIDGFLLQRLGKEHLKFSPEAPPETLIRRVTLDLTGLPPTPAEVEAFLKDPSPAAYEKVVDRLLASPALRRAHGHSGWLKAGSLFRHKWISKRWACGTCGGGAIGSSMRFARICLTISSQSSSRGRPPAECHSGANHSFWFSTGTIERMSTKAGIVPEESPG